jgi:hypothetical protein
VISVLAQDGASQNLGDFGGALGGGQVVGRGQFDEWHDGFVEDNDRRTSSAISATQEGNDGQWWPFHGKFAAVYDGLTPPVS